MLKISNSRLAKLDEDYPGLRETILHFESLALPACPGCASPNTATVQGGLIGRSMALAVSTTRIKLLPNGSKDTPFYCNECGTYFGQSDRPPPMSDPS